MPAATVHLKLEQGSTFILDLEIKNAEPELIDVTGWSGACQMRLTPDSDDFYNMHVAMGEPGSSGVINIWMTADETSQIVCNPSKTYKPKSTFYAYDVELTDPEGNVQRILQGSIEVIPEITK